MVKVKMIYKVEILKCPSELFAKGIEEGDVVVKQNGIYEKDAQTTEQLRREVNELLDRLIKRNERK